MIQSKLLLLAVLLAGVSIGAWTRGAITDSMPETTPALSAEVQDDAGSASSSTTAPGTVATQQELLKTIESLQSGLDAAKKERAYLRGQIDDLAARLDNVAADTPGAFNAEAAKQRAVASRRRSAGSLTVKGLTEAGIAENEAIAIKSRLDELALQRLYLRDQAMREGALGKGNYQQELRRITNAQNNLEQEFGRDVYERYLYAVGRPNRVTVQSVMQNSPAYSAGLQTGDRIVSYDNNPVYSPNEIRRGSSGGSAGEMVPIIVERNGSTTDLYIPRGPLGIQMNSDSIKPPDSP